MHRPIKTFQPCARTFIRAEIAYRADICAEMLNQARRLSHSGKVKSPLLKLVSRACDLLDDIDAMLVVLSPTRDPPPFATVARLHRQLEHLQAEITAQRRAHLADSRFAGG